MNTWTYSNLHHFIDTCTSWQVGSNVWLASMAAMWPCAGRAQALGQFLAFFKFFKPSSSPTSLLPFPSSSTTSRAFPALPLLLQLLLEAPPSSPKLGSSPPSPSSLFSSLVCLPSFFFLFLCCVWWLISCMLSAAIFAFFLLSCGSKLPRWWLLVGWRPAHSDHFFDLLRGCRKGSPAGAPLLLLSFLLLSLLFDVLALF